jgi:hypothetical protein
MPWRRPKHWDDIKDPVCRLDLDLYGHPLAGLLWEKFCQNILMEEGFDKVPSWECFLFTNKQSCSCQFMLTILNSAAKLPQWTTCGQDLGKGWNWNHQYQ